MAGNPWDREVIQLNERPLSSDVNLTGSYMDYEIRDLFTQLYSARNTQSNPGGYDDDSASVQPSAAVPIVGSATPVAFIGAAFKCRPGTGMHVVLDPGLGFHNTNSVDTSIGAVSGIDDRALLKPLSLTAAETIAVPTADPTNPRIDIIEVKNDRRLTDPTSRDIFNPLTGAFVANSVNKTLSYNQNGRSSVNGTGSINYKTGTPAGSPVAATVDSGYTKIAEIDVAANVTSILRTNIRDYRMMLGLGGALPFAVLFRVHATCASGAPAIDSGASGGCCILANHSPPGMLMTPIAFGNGRAEFQFIIAAGNMPNVVGGQPIAELSIIAGGTGMPPGLIAPVWLSGSGGAEPGNWGVTTAAQAALQGRSSAGITMGTGQPIYVSKNAIAQPASGPLNDTSIVYMIRGSIGANTPG